MQQKTHNETVVFNYAKAMEMIEHGVANKTLTEKDGKIMVISGVRRKWVTKEALAKQIANNRKMMTWLSKLVNFSDKMTALKEEDEKNGTVTEVSVKDIPMPKDED